MLRASSVPSIGITSTQTAITKILNGHFSVEDVVVLLEKDMECIHASMVRSFSCTAAHAALINANYKVATSFTVYMFTCTEESTMSTRHQLTRLARSIGKLVTIVTADLLEFAAVAECFGLADKNTTFPAW